MFPYTDVITIISRSTDTDGVKSNTTTAGVAARIEDSNELVFDKDGAQVSSSMLIITKYGETIKPDDLIVVTKKSGIVYEDDEERSVISVKHLTMFNSHHYEVIV